MKKNTQRKRFQEGKMKKKNDLKRHCHYKPWLAVACSAAGKNAKKNAVQRRFQKSILKSVTTDSEKNAKKMRITRTTSNSNKHNNRYLPTSIRLSQLNLSKNRATKVN